MPQWITPIDRYGNGRRGDELARLAKSGALVRVRHGLYLSKADWDALKPWEKYECRIKAVHTLARKPPIFAGRSACQLLGIPVVRIPPFVEVIVPTHSRSGRSFGDVRRYSRPPNTTAIVRLGPFRVTARISTAIDCAVLLPFCDALPVMDAVLRRAMLAGPTIGADGEPVPSDGADALRAKIRTAANELPVKTHRRRVLTVLGCADPESESAGESLSRAVMISKGFPAPLLQHELRDAAGRIGFVDYFWPNFGLVGEFDGWAKYSQDQYLQGQLPAEVLRREKVREDRIRATGLRVVRWMWADALAAEPLAGLLRAAGLPSSSF